MVHVLGLFPDVCRFLCGLPLDVHGFQQALNGPFPGSGTFHCFRINGGDHYSDTLPHRSLSFM